MCFKCEPYRPEREDARTNTVEDAAEFERQRAEDAEPPMTIRDI